MKLFNKRFNFIALLILIIFCTSASAEQVSYLKEPSDADEQAVANTIESMILSYNEKDIEKHLSCYAPDARIHSKLARGYVSRDDYRQVLKGKKSLPTVRLKDTQITKVSEDKYRVFTKLVGTRSSSYLIYDLAPIEGKWLVIEQRYK
jgi:hypothetical protein